MVGSRGRVMLDGAARSRSSMGMSVESISDWTKLPKGCGGGQARTQHSSTVDEPVPAGCAIEWRALSSTPDLNGGGRWVWVCEIGELRMRGGSLSALYVGFFTGAFTALEAVL